MGLKVALCLLLDNIYLGLHLHLSGLIPYKIYEANCELVKFWLPKFVT